MPETSEKRKAERKIIRQNAQFELPSGQLVAIRTRDIGVTGMGLLSESNFKTEQACAVRLVLILPGLRRQPLQLKGNVAHCIFSHATGGFQVGMAFHGLTNDSVQAIQEFMRSTL